MLSTLDNALDVNNRFEHFMLSTVESWHCIPMMVFIMLIDKYKYS